MPIIENASRFDIRTGFHMKVKPDTILIQISDMGCDQPTPIRKFNEIYQFFFDDVEIEDHASITDTHASLLAKILTVAHSKNQDIIVHCHAGICRSGAVVEAGIYVGFEPSPNRNRMANSLVKGKIVHQIRMQRELRTHRQFRYT